MTLYTIPVIVRCLYAVNLCFLGWDGCFINIYGNQVCVNIAQQRVIEVDGYEYFVYSPVKSHTTAPSFVHGTKGLTGFSSLYAVTAESAKAIEQAGTTAQFKGVVWGERLWIDTDTYEAADEVEKRLREMEYGFVAYHSGGRGVHFGVDRVAAPSHLLPAQDKAWVQSHFQGCADTSIYTHLHLFRLPGTVHETHNQEKQLVLEVPGKTLVHPRWEKKDVSIGTGLNSNVGSGSIFDCARVMANTMWARKNRVPIGERHPTLVRITYALRDDAKASPDTALWWISEVNKLSEDPREPEHLEQIVRSVYGG